MKFLTIMACLIFTLSMAEIMIFLKMTKQIGFFSVVLLTICTAVWGAALARKQGLNTLQALQAKLSQGQIPTDQLLDGIMILVASAFLLTPGLITDALGFSLLVPACRNLWRSAIKKNIKFKTHTSFSNSSPFQNRQSPSAEEDFIDVEGEFRQSEQIEDKKHS